jgi:hypothetical protein
MTLFIGSCLGSFGVSAQLQPSTRILVGILGIGFSLAALRGANLHGTLLGSVLASSARRPH